jgi:hypothetical protein
MSNALTSLIFGIGIGGWAYVMLTKNTGRQRSSLIGAAIAGVVGFFVIFTTIELLLGW